MPFLLAELVSMTDPVMLLLAGGALLAAGWLLADFVRGRQAASKERRSLAPAPLELEHANAATPCTPWGRVRQVLRRGLWFYLVPLAILAFLALYNYQVNRAATSAATSTAAAGGSVADIANNAAQAAAEQSAKVVDPTLVEMKLATALVVFFLIMALGWGGLKLAMPVVADWATGDYADPAKAATLGLDGPVAGFKRSFLRQSDTERVNLLFKFFGLFVLAAGIGVWAGFSVQ